MTLNQTGEELSEEQTVIGYNGFFDAMEKLRASREQGIF